MEKPEFYDEAPIINGENLPLQPGGYVCIIKKAVEDKSQTTGNPMLVLLLDIAEGERKNYFQDRFNKDTRENKKWGCVLRIVKDDKNKPIEERKKYAGRLKGIINCINNSNDGYEFDWSAANNLETLKDKIVGAEFGLEEYTAKDGSTKVITKIRGLRNKNSVDKILIPKVRLLNGTYMEYDDYMEIKEEQKSSENEGYITVNEDELPF